MEVEAGGFVFRARARLVTGLADEGGVKERGKDLSVEGRPSWGEEDGWGVRVR